MQNLYEFLVINEFNICTTSLDSRYKNIFLIAKSNLPPAARQRDCRVSWEAFLNMKKDFVLRFNSFIVTLTSDKQDYYFSSKETCLWGELYSKLGMNFLNYLFDNCKLFLEWYDGLYINVGMKRSLSLKKYSYNKEKRGFNQSGYDRLIQICRNKMMYNNVIKDGTQSLIVGKNILEEVLKQNVGRKVQYKLKYTTAVVKLKKIGSTNLTVLQMRKLLKNYLPQNEIIVPRESVLSFLQKILTMIIPCRIFNKRQNFNKFLKNISLIVESDLLHCITLGEVMDGIEGNNEVFQNLCAKIVFWLINEVILKIISCCFYVTETNKSKELIYIPVNHWINKERQALEELITKGHLKKLMTNEQSIANNFDYTNVSSIRFIPKETLSKFRPIIHKSLFQKNTEKFAKICNIFLKQLLATEKKTVTNISSNVHKYWSNFVKKIDKKGHIYYVKTDIKDAFGSILHEMLKNILIKLFNKLKSPYLTLTQYECTGLGKRMMTVCEQFSELHLTLSSKLIRKSTISRKVSVIKMKEYIFHYINNIYIKLKNSRQTYHYVKGLPQGMKLSAALCDLYYSDFDTNYLQNLFNPDEGDILLRLVDDYLYISKNRKRTIMFLDRIISLSPKYGFEIQKDKTLTNIFSDQLLYKSGAIPYIGYLFNLQEKTVSLDLSIYEGKPFKSTISFRTSLDLEGFKRRMLNLSAIRVNSILFDVSILNKRTILINLFKVACLMALRFDAIYWKLPMNQRNFKIIFAILKKAITTLVSKISCRNRFLQRKGKGSLRGATAYYLIIKTFIMALRKKSHYRNYLTKMYAMLEILRKNMSARECKIINRITKNLPSSLM